MKRPSFQFYPGDWLRSADVRGCSVGARGLWIDMICFMHEGTPYGHLRIGGKVILPPNLARMTGATLQEVEGWLIELKEAGVCSVDDEGCIFSRRMLRDEKLRQSRAKGGILGGNPNLKVSSKVEGKVNLQGNLQLTPASSSASASALDNDKSLSNIFPTWIPVEEWQAWLKIRKSKSNTEHALKLSIQKLQKWKDEGYDVKLILENSIANGYQGLFLPKEVYATKKQKSAADTTNEQIERMKSKGML